MKTSLLSLKTSVPDEGNSSDSEETDKRNKCNDSYGKQIQGLNENKPQPNVHGENSQSSSSDALINTTKEKKSKETHLEKDSKKKHTENPCTVDSIMNCSINKEEQTSSLSESLLKVKKHKPSSTFSFSLLSYFKEPIEASHLSDYELEQSDFLSNWPAEVKMESDILLPTLTESSKASYLLEPELEKSSSLPSFSTAVKMDSDNNLLKEPIERVGLADSELKKSNDSETNLNASCENIQSSLQNMSPIKQKKKSKRKHQEKEYSESSSKESSISKCLLNEENKSYESETNSNAYDENIQSSLENLSPIKRKKKSKRKHQEKEYSESSSKETSISNCLLSEENKSNILFVEHTQEPVKIVSETSLNDYGENMTLTKQKKKSKKKHQEKKDSESSSTFSKCLLNKDDPVSSIPSSLSEDVRASMPSKMSYSMTEEDYSVSFLKRSSLLTKEDVCSPLKRSRYRTKEDSSTPFSKKSYPRTEEGVSTPLKRRNFPTEENSPTPSLERSPLISECHQMEVNKNESKNSSILSIPHSQHLPSEETLHPLSFYRRFPPPSLKRTHSMTEEDSENNRYGSPSSIGDHKSNNFAFSYSPIIKGRRSLPAKVREDFFSTTDKSSHPARHSSSFHLGTPKHSSNFSDSSKRQSYHNKYSSPSTFRSCATDQTPYSPNDFYRQHKRFKSELPYYSASDLLTFQSEVGFIDSHCHLDFLFDRLHYDGSFKDYQRKNKDTFPVCFKGCIAIFCNPPTFRRKHFWHALLEEENVWASFGCHPHHAKHYNDEVEESLIQALNHSKVCALGEIGLDYSNRNDCPKNMQEKVFTRQLKIALEKKLPLIIHCRDAHEDGMDIMKRMVPKNYLIHLHCFTDTWEKACKWLDEFPNLYIGLTNVVTFPSAANVHEVARKISLSRLLLETDAPYFVPRPLAKHPSNPKFSHPGMALHVAAQVAALKGGIPLELVLHKTRQNTKTVYSI